VADFVHVKIQNILERGHRMRKTKDVQKIDTILRETDTSTADISLEIAKQLLEHRSTIEAVTDAWGDDAEKPSNSPFATASKGLHR
jgi:hypothetical protein